MKECEGKHGVAKIFAKASWRAAGKSALLFWEAGRHSKSSGADYGPLVQEHTHKHTQTNPRRTNKSCVHCPRTYLPPACTHVCRNIRCPRGGNGGVGICKVTTLCAPWNDTIGPHTTWTETNRSVRLLINHGLLQNLNDLFLKNTFDSIALLWDFLCVHSGTAKVKICVRALAPYRARCGMPVRRKKIPIWAQRIFVTTKK